MLLLSATSSFAATFEADLDPVAYDNSTRTIVEGEGKVIATLKGSALSISGNFQGLSSDATVAHLGIARIKGAPAETFFIDLTVTRSAAGTIAGAATLTQAQVDAINVSTLFVRLDSVKGPGGSLWGWFEPVRSAR